MAAFEKYRSVYTHDELMEHDGIYKKLYELSRRTEILHQELS